MENGEEIDVSTAPEFEAYRRLDREIVEAGYPNWQERQYRLVCAQVMFAKGTVRVWPALSAGCGHNPVY